MRCYNCGFDAEGSVCPNCGAPMQTYRDIMTLSAAYYNDGLDRAKSRDLSGAVRALQMCLKFDKNNIPARNLLGLIYYETGETVHAITQWVISKNLQQDDNIVDGYLDELRRSPDRLDSMNRAIKQYNFALRSARKGHLDAARIQLKKVLQINPKLLKARQLLALLYIRRQDYARARYELTQCQRIDVASDKTIRYLKEIDRVVHEKNVAKEEAEPNKKNKQQAVAYRSGNDTIIQPARGFASGGALSLISVAAGLALGVAATAFLIVPARERRVQIQSNDRIAAISEESDAKTVRLTEAEHKAEELETQLAQLERRLEIYEGERDSSVVVDGLMGAAASYIGGETEIETLAAYMENIAATDFSEDENDGYRQLYNAVVAQIGPDLSTYYFERGSAAMQANNLSEAVRLYGLASQYDAKNAEAMYNYAEATRLNGDAAGAKLIYDQVVSAFPGTRRASDAQAKIVELNN